MPPVTPLFPVTIVTQPDPGMGVARWARRGGDFPESPGRSACDGRRGSARPWQQRVQCVGGAVGAVVGVVGTPDTIMRK
ncbi:hypothetical protein E2C01_043878 [Portunus trituberculatus]|uniref:Uncharacterized protein n=1 Tax=Portunus trituberculatus TaxID=210409 RepID=A0A5B7FWV0_PORTR|nr:hypothetical protein [Portunus trituberculatus]